MLALKHSDVLFFDGSQQKVGSALAAGIRAGL
jgi:hypothetical protein